MRSPVADKLGHFEELSDADVRALDAMVGERVRRYERRTDVIREGDDPQVMHVVLSGWVCRYKQLPDGRRQIVALMLPGDVCDRDIFLLRTMDHTLGALTPVTLAQVLPARYQTLARVHPRVERALARDMLVHAAVAREWVLNLGQRDAVERLAHLFCELFYRLRAVGLTQDTSYELPLTQEELSQIMGITAVHVNRSLMELRSAGLIALKGRMLAIPDLGNLEATALFTPDYLHLQRGGKPFEADET